METFFILLAVGAAAIPISLVVLVFLAVRYGRRISALEARLDLLAPSEIDVSKAPIATDIKLPAPLEKTPDPVGEKTNASPPRSFVIGAGRMRDLGAWLAVNWIYLVAAASLALAGIFLLQYGVENGFLPPVMRVVLAMSFGAILIAAGEYMRRRWGDDEGAATAFLPSVFSGAGIVTLFATVLAALHLYALIGPITAMAGLILVAVVAIVLGWYSGPLLAAVGILGAMLAPYVVGGTSDNLALLYVYFGIITLVGMVIDALRRWAWITVLSLVAGYGAALLLSGLSGGEEWLLVFVTILALAAIVIPPLRLTPTHQGAAMSDMFVPGLPRGWPDFPVRVAWGAVSVSVVTISNLSYIEGDLFWPSIVAMAALFALMTIWARHAPALEDLSAGPLIGVGAILALQGLYEGAQHRAFHAVTNAVPEAQMPSIIFVLAGLGALLSLIAAWRSLAQPRWPIVWAAGAAITGPLTLVVLEIWWQPAKVLPPYPWALVAMAMAGLMAVMASWFLRRDGHDKRRVALFVLAALSMISFGLILVLSQAALTVALAATMLAAALLDRRFNMAAMAWFVQVAVVVIGWRLIVAPGIYWAIHIGISHVFLAFGGAITALIATYMALRPQNRTSALIMLESAIWSLSAIFLSVVIFRVLENSGVENSHLSTGLVALIWLISAANQLWRLQTGGRWMKGVRMGLATLFGAFGFFLLLAALLALNPLLRPSEPVLGAVLLNSLVIAYLAPALVFGVVAWRFSFLPGWFRNIATILAAALGAFWLALAIRHFWQGPILAGKTMPQGELYSYTIALLLAGAGCLYQAVSKGSTALRRVAMTLIALTAAKVYLIDMSGLTGLTRVFSFLALGLSLAALAWLNRWASGRATPTVTAEPETQIP